jgi:chromosome segregation ATPase
LWKKETAMGRVAMALLAATAMWVVLAAASVAAAEQEKGREAEGRVEKAGNAEQIEQLMRKAKELDEQGKGDAAAELKRQAERLRAQAGGREGDQEVAARLKHRIRTLQEMAETAQKEGMPDLAAQLRNRAEQTERELREILGRTEGQPREERADRPRERAEGAAPSPEGTAAAMRELAQNQERLRNQVTELSREVERLRDAVAQLERRLNEAGK